MTSFSIVVIAHQSRKNIVKVIRSICAQTNFSAKTEIIIISSITDAEAASRLVPDGLDLPDWLTVRVQHLPVADLYTALDQGLSEAAGDYVCLLDSNGLFSKTHLASVAQQFSGSLDVLMVCCRPNMRITRRILNGRANASFSAAIPRRLELPCGEAGRCLNIPLAPTWVRRLALVEKGLTFRDLPLESSLPGDLFNHLATSFGNQRIVLLESEDFVSLETVVTRDKQVAEAAQAFVVSFMDFRAAQLQSLLQPAHEFDDKSSNAAAFAVFAGMTVLTRRQLFRTYARAEIAKRLFDAIGRIVRPIPNETINAIKIKNSFEPHRVAILHHWKNAKRNHPRLYLRNVDRERGYLQFGAFHGELHLPVVCKVNGIDVPIENRSKLPIGGASPVYVYQHMFWVKAAGEGTINVEIDGRRCDIRCGKKVLGENTSIEKLTRIYLRKNSSVLYSLSFSALATVRQAFVRDKGDVRGCWLIMDRDDKADDNAEHFYKYLQKTEFAQKIFFLLRRSSPDWERLKNEGFRLIPFGSMLHLIAQSNAAAVCYSHLTQAVLYPFRKIPGWKASLGHKVVFLGHGVTLCELSSAFNSKNIDIFVTATPDEQNSIGGFASNYKMSERESQMVGLSRHDTLMERPQARKYILVMPTWRKYLSGKTLGKGLQRDFNEKFSHSDFAQAWMEFFHDNRLRQIAEKHSVGVVFCPHPNLVPYLDGFDLPRYVTVYNQFEGGSLQKLIAEAALLLTDYSSVAFDVAFLNKPVVYYQFDFEYASAMHLDPGYFEFPKHGFGPVCKDLGGVLESIGKALAGLEEPQYEMRRLQTFPMRDGRNRERTFLATKEILGK